MRTLNTATRSAPQREGGSFTAGGASRFKSGSPLLLDILRGSNRPVASAALSDLVANAEQHGLSTVLERCLSASGTPVPPDIAHRLRQQRRTWTVTGMRNKVLLLRALTALAAVDVVPIVLKGYAFALRYYPEPLLRPSLDVDLLVHREELPAVQTALPSIGLTRYDDAREGMDSYHHHIAFTGAGGLVEVHFRATSGLGLKEQETGLTLAWQPATIEGCGLRLLRPEEELVYLAVHASQHLFQRLNWLHDLKLFLDTTPLNSARVHSIARDWRMVPAVYAALYATQLVFGTSLPIGSVIPQPARWQRALIHRLFTEHRLVSGTLLGNKIRRWLVHAALAEGPVRITRDGLDAVKLKLRRVLRQYLGDRH